MHIAGIVGGQERDVARHASSKTAFLCDIVELDNDVAGPGLDQVPEHARRGVDEPSGLRCASPGRRGAGEERTPGSTVAPRLILQQRITRSDCHQFRELAQLGYREQQLYEEFVGGGELARCCPGPEFSQTASRP